MAQVRPLAERPLKPQKVVIVLDEVLATRHSSGGRHESRLSRNGTLFSGSIHRNGLGMFS